MNAPRMPLGLARDREVVFILPSRWWVRVLPWPPSDMGTMLSKLNKES